MPSNRNRVNHALLHHLSLTGARFKGRGKRVQASACASARQDVRSPLLQPNNESQPGAGRQRSPEDAQRVAPVAARLLAEAGGVAAVLDGQLAAPRRMGGVEGEEGQQREGVRV